MPSQFHLYSQDIQETKQVSTFHLLSPGLEVHPEVKVTKVKQAEVTNGHKLLFCKMNKMSHCCVELLQVFTILFLSTGQGFHFGGHQGQAGGGNQLGRFGLQQGQAGVGNQLGRFGLQQGQAGGPHQGQAGRGNQLGRLGLQQGQAGGGNQWP